jgi:hypothetical protein
LVYDHLEVVDVDPASGACCLRKILGLAVDKLDRGVV